MFRLNQIESKEIDRKQLAQRLDVELNQWRKARLDDMDAMLKIRANMDHTPIPNESIFTSSIFMSIGRKTNTAELKQYETCVSFKNLLQDNQVSHTFISDCIGYLDQLNKYIAANKKHFEKLVGKEFLTNIQEISKQIKQWCVQQTALEYGR
jgi:hypothetical protein